MQFLTLTRDTYQLICKVTLHENNPDLKSLSRTTAELYDFLCLVNINKAKQKRTHNENGSVTAGFDH